MTFSDSGTHTSIVVASGGVQPASVTFTNNTIPYSFSGGAISGTGSVTLNGSSRVTFFNANAYSGGTTISSLATLNIQNGQALGSGAVTVADSGELQLQGGITVTGVPLTIAGNGVYISWQDGALHSLSGNNVWNGNINLATGVGFAGQRRHRHPDDQRQHRRHRHHRPVHPGQRHDRHGRRQRRNQRRDFRQQLALQEFADNHRHQHDVDAQRRATRSRESRRSGPAQFVLGNRLALQNSTYVGGVNNGLWFTPGIGTFTIGGLSDAGYIAGSGNPPTAFSTAGINNGTLADTSGGAITLQVGNNGASTTYSGVLSGPGGLTKLALAR